VSFVELIDGPALGEAYRRLVLVCGGRHHPPLERRAVNQFHQVALLAYVENFWLISLVCLLCVPLVFLFRRVKARGGAVAAH
jgi:hypothetical protein